MTCPSGAEIAAVKGGSGRIQADGGGELATALAVRQAPGLLELGAHVKRPPPMRDNIRLVSSAGTGYTYYTKKNKRANAAKLELKKYDPVVRKHVPFKEAKMPPHSK